MLKRKSNPMRFKIGLFSVVLISLLTGITNVALADEDDRGGLSFSFGFSQPGYYQPPPPPIYYQRPPVFYNTPPQAYYAQPEPRVYYQPSPGYWGHQYEEDDDDE